LRTIEDKQDVDGRVKPGHDGVIWTACALPRLFVTKDTCVLIIAQISDLHVRPHGQTAYGIDTNAMFADALRAVRALDPAPDCVLVTGDLTDCGLDAEYEIARAGLATLPMPVFVIPGNHDRREPFRRHLSPAHPYLDHDRPRLDYVDDRFPVRLIGLDSLVDGETYGDLEPHQLEWLDARLSEGGGRPTLVFVHHPPFLTGISAMDDLWLRSGDALGRVLARHTGVLRLLAGHYHRPITAMFGGTLAFCAPSIAHQVALDLACGRPTRFIMEPPALTVHTWLPDIGMTTHLTPIRNHGPGFEVVLEADYPGAQVRAGFLHA
jgi:3',5'-cyclic AMP phosphodiesterase CpdA